MTQNSVIYSDFTDIHLCRLEVFLTVLGSSPCFRLKKKSCILNKFLEQFLPLIILEKFSAPLHTFSYDRPLMENLSLDWQLAHHFQNISRVNFILTLLLWNKLLRLPYETMFASSPCHLRRGKVLQLYCRLTLLSVSSTLQTHAFNTALVATVQLRVAGSHKVSE